MSTKLKKITALNILAASLLAAHPAYAESTYVLVLPAGEAQKKADFEVNLNGKTFPLIKQGNIYDPFNFNELLLVQGDPNLDLSQASWQITEGTLPAGLTLSNQGVLSGKPSQTGVSQVTVQAEYKGKTTSKTYSFNVAPLVVKHEPTQITTPIVGVQFDNIHLRNRVTVDGIVPEKGVVKFTATSPLPKGLELSSDGDITGILSAIGSAYVYYEYEAYGSKGNGNLYIPLTYFEKIPPFTVGAPYHYDVKTLAGFKEAQGLSGWSITGTPSGLSLSEDGILSGTSLHTVPVNLTISADTPEGVRITRIVQLPVTPMEILPNGIAGLHYTHNLMTLSGFNELGGPIEWTLSGAPAGFTISDEGLLHGVATEKGTFTLTITGTSENNSVTRTLKVTTGDYASLPIPSGLNYSFDLKSLPGFENIGANAVWTVKNLATTPNAFKETPFINQSLAGYGFTYDLSNWDGFDTITDPAAAFASTSGFYIFDKDGVLHSYLRTRATQNIFEIEAVDGTKSAKRIIYFDAMNIQNLPEASVGTYYEFDLKTAEGFSHLPAGTTFTTKHVLPTGLSLSLEGVISGTPTKAETTSNEIKADNGGKLTIRDIKLKVN